MLGTHNLTSYYQECKQWVLLGVRFKRSINVQRCRGSECGQPGGGHFSDRRKARQCTCKKLHFCLWGPGIDNSQTAEICPELGQYLKTFQSLSGVENEDANAESDVGETFRENDDIMGFEPAHDEFFEDVGDDTDTMLDDGRAADRQELDLQAELDKDEYDRMEAPTTTSFIDELDTSFSKLEVVLKDSIARGGTEYSYFDPRLMMNWAGPQHWKFHGSKRAPACVSGKKNSQEKSKKKARDPLIKFCAETVVENIEKVKSFKSLQMSEQMIQRAMENADDLVFPIDTHYSRSELFSLFLKPRTKFQVRNNDSIAPVDDATVEPEYDDGDGFDNGACDVQDDHFDAINDEIDFLDDDFAAMNLVEADRKIDKIDIKYETIAKRVDVKHLKENIWVHMESKFEGRDDEKQNAIEFESVVHSVAEKVGRSALWSASFNTWIRYHQTFPCLFISFACYTLRMKRDWNC